jgi:hypothetical protein
METYEGVPVERMPTVNESDLTDIVNKTANVTLMAQRIAKAVNSEETEKAAVAFCQELQGEADFVKNKYSVLRDFLDKSHKAVTGRIATLVKPRTEAIDTVKYDGLKRYAMQKEMARRAEEERLAAEQRKRDEEQKLAAAIHLEKENPVLSEAILNSPIQSAPPVVPVSKPEGMGSRKTWAVRCLNKRELIKGISGGRVPEGAVIVDLKWLTAQAKLMDGNLHYPGVEVYEDMDISISRKRAVV